ncbi:hypothetical protein MLD38_039201 [Melastoma candidum]|uniref:Uncharacterized protein n=1 Tax=Melastoma candidum TaxID=119954 RepID=A0ACB9L2K0_9MYRT|nr:hypothetical protein MLD38_039201 [Melastoma candidum]
MNSMFSPFDLLLLELLGRKLCVVPDRFRQMDNEKNKKPSSEEKLTRVVFGSPSPAKSEISPKQRKNQPRFAVELDGLHCYETIVRD